MVADDLLDCIASNLVLWHFIIRDHHSVIANLNFGIEFRRKIMQLRPTGHFKAYCRVPPKLTTYLFLWFDSAQVLVLIITESILQQ